MGKPAARRVGVAALAALAILAGQGLRTQAQARGNSTPVAVTVRVDAARRGGTINQDLVGVNHPVAGAGAAMRALGVRWARVDAWFQESVGGTPDYQCKTGAWNPLPLDQRVGLARDEGARPLVIVDYTPRCLASVAPPGTDPTLSPPDAGAQRRAWDALVYEMAYHEIVHEGVRSFEVWNEPDGTFWTGTLAAYLTLYDDTARVLERAAAAAHQRIEVGGPALVFADSAWIEPFLAFVAARGLPLDFLSWHYYANYPAVGPIGPVPSPPPGTPPYWYNPALRTQTYGAQVLQVRAELSKYPSLHPLLWLDEWNADAGYDRRHDGPFDAALAASVLDSVQGAGLDRMCFFFVADDASDPLGNWGLLTSSLKPKPVYQAFRFWHAMAPNSVAVALSPDQSSSDPIGRVGALASAGASGTVTILLYDFLPYDPTGAYGTSASSPFDHPVTLQVDGLSGRSYGWTESVVDGTHSGTATQHGAVKGPRTTLHLKLAAEGVALVTLSPEQP